MSKSTGITSIRFLTLNRSSKNVKFPLATHLAKVGGKCLIQLLASLWNTTGNTASDKTGTRRAELAPLDCNLSYRPCRVDFPRGHSRSLDRSELAGLCGDFRICACRPCKDNRCRFAEIWDDPCPCNATRGAPVTGLLCSNTSLLSFEYLSRRTGNILSSLI